MPHAFRPIAIIVTLLATGQLAACAETGGATPPGFTPVATPTPTSGAGPGKSALPQGGS